LTAPLAESPAAARAILERLFSAIPVAADGNAGLRLDGGSLVNLAAEEGDKEEMVAGPALISAGGGLCVRAA
jgi:hypothetical protein